MSETPNSEGLPSFLERFFANEIDAWRGDADLARVFWVNGVLTSAVLMVLYATTIYLQQRIAEQLLLILLAAYTIWIVVSIWRCAAPSETFWATLARYLTIFWALNSGLVLFFRELDLLAKFAGLSGPAGF